MKTPHLVSILSALMLTPALAQTPNPNANGNPGADIAAVAASANNGYWLRGNEPVITRNGVTTKLTTDDLLPNGLRVQADGTVTLRDGTTSQLRRHEILMFDGQFVPLPAVLESQAGAAPASVPPDVSARQQKAVGLSAFDGITVSGTDMLITRNGVSDKLTKDVKLPNGVVAKPDGTVVLANGQKILLRPDQLIDLNGVLREAPVQPNPPGPAPSASSPNP